MGINIINHGLINDSLQSVTDTNTFYNDSTHQLLKHKQPTTKSLFTSHELNFKTFSPNPIPAKNKDWISFTLLGCFALFVFIKLFYKAKFLKISKSFYSKKIFFQYSREGQILRKQIFYPLILIYIITTSFVVFQYYCIYTNTDISRPDSFIIFKNIFFLIFLYLIFKILIIKILSPIFKIKNKNNLLILNLFIFKSFTGIILFFLLIFSTFLFTKFLVIFNLIILGIMFIIKAYRNFLIGLSFNNYSVLYNILYLCSIEILPLLLLVKIIINYLIII